MGFTHLKTGGTKAAASSTTKQAEKAPETAKVPEKEVQAEVVKTVGEHAADAGVQTSTALATTHTERGMSAFGNGGMGKSVLAVITKADEARGLMFPVLQLAGGNSGGSFAPIKAVPEEVANQMPQGKKPFEGFIVAYRSEMVSWPVGFDDKEDDSRPVWSVAVPSDDAVGADLLRNAGKRYQFTKNVDKSKFDHAQSGVGHARPQLQLLVWLPDVEDLIVVQTPSHFESWRKTAEQLNRNADPKTGEVLKFPALLRPVSTVKNINGFTVTEHVIDITAMLNEAGAALAQKFAAWREKAKLDPELVNKVGEWASCGDHPRTPELDAILKKCASL